jgi:hypothetical protein
MGGRSLAERTEGSMSNSWSGSRPFVGRTAVRGTLAREVDAVIRGSGRAVFLLGPRGSGQTACIAVFQEEAFRRREALRAEYVDCAHSGTETWAELAEIFTRGHRLRRSARKVAVDWLESIPIAGKILQAVVRTVVALRTGRVDTGLSDRVSRASAQSAVGAVRLLLEYEPREPRLVVMDSLDRGDSEDLAGTSALIRRLPETRTLFLAAVRTEDGKPPEAIGDLILEAERLGCCTRVELPPLSMPDIGEAVSKATGRIAPLEWVAWLATESGGNPGALWSLLGELEGEGLLRRSGRRWAWEGSPPMRAPSRDAAPSRDWQLSDDDRRLMGLAALEGRFFHSAVLAQVTEMSELDVEDRLSILCRLGLIEYSDAPACGDDVTSRYAFRDPADWEACKNMLPTSERDRYAASLGEVRARLGL